MLLEVCVKNKCCLSTPIIQPSNICFVMVIDATSLRIGVTLPSVVSNNIILSPICIVSSGSVISCANDTNLTLSFLTIK